MLRIVQLDQLSQQRFGRFFLDRFGDGRRRLIHALPVGNETFAVLCALAVLGLPALLANIRPAKLRFLLEQQRVIMLPVGKSSAAAITDVAARLYVPFRHEKKSDAN